jgi:microcystin-dependent protein
MTTANKALNQPAYNSSAWDTPLNNNFGYLDAALGNTATISNTTAYTLVASEYQCMRLLFNGSLAADLTISIPSGVGGFWIVTNSTTDLSTSAIKYLTINTTASGSLGITPPRGSSVVIYSDGTHVGYVEGTAPVPASSITSGSALVIPGTVINFAGSTAPTGYLTCDGSAISRSTYASLFAAIGTTWGAGNSTTTFNIPDLRGYFLRGSGTSARDPDSPRAVGSAQTEAYLNHSHTATDSGHTHGSAVTSPASGGFVSPNNGTQGAFITAGQGGGTLYYSTLSGTGNAAITVATSTTGGAETRPDNVAVLYCIKT